MTQSQSQKINKKTAILVYVYYPDILDHIVQLIKQIDLSSVDIFIAINNSLSVDLIKDICKDINPYIKNIVSVDNLGVDILPFLSQLISLDNNIYKYFIKIHTKKSRWGSKSNIRWLSVLLHAVIGSNKIFKNNILKLDRHTNIGMIGPKAFIIDNRESIHSTKIKELCGICDMDYDFVRDGKFVAGSIFMARLEPFIKYFTKDRIEIIKNLILANNEIGSVKDIYSLDGKYSHSLERLFGYIIHANGMKIFGNKLINYRILNKEAEKGYFSLVICYDGLCYLDEDPNCAGQFYPINDNICAIEWKHMKHIDYVFQKYTKLNNNTLIKN